MREFKQKVQPGPQRRLKKKGFVGEENLLHVNMYQASHLALSSNHNVQNTDLEYSREGERLRYNLPDTSSGLQVGSTVLSIQTSIKMKG